MEPVKTHLIQKIRSAFSFLSPRRYSLSPYTVLLLLLQSLAKNLALQTSNPQQDLKIWILEHQIPALFFPLLLSVFPQQVSCGKKLFSFSPLLFLLQSCLASYCGEFVNVIW